VFNSTRGGSRVRARFFERTSLSDEALQSLCARYPFFFCSSSAAVDQNEAVPQLLALVASLYPERYTRHIRIGDTGTPMADIPSLIFANAGAWSTLAPAEAERVARYTGQFRSPATIGTWKSRWRTILLYCAKHDYTPFPLTPEVTSALLAELADNGYAFATIREFGAAISAIHKLCDQRDPMTDRRVRNLMHGIMRVLGTDHPHRKEALLIDELARIRELALSSGSDEGFQDWALFSLGFFGALRRGELVALDLADVSIEADAVYLTIQRSKTEQFSSRELRVPRRTDALCPVRAVEAWIAHLASKGPLFRTVRRGRIHGTRITTRTVGRLVQRYCANIGLNPQNFAAHSLRVGYATYAISSGEGELPVALHMRHRDFQSLLCYFRPRVLRRDLVTGVLNGR
jgi:integrase